jgi:hypothetical protein
MGRKISFKVSDKSGSVTGIYEKSGKGDRLLVLGHGAGAPMHSTGMQLIAETLASKGISTLRYNFPYMEKGIKRPDVPAVAQLTVRKAVEKAKSLEPGAKIYAGGKSFGGRMTSQAESEEFLGVEGLVFYGFPLHAPGRDGVERADHLNQVKIPMLFLQGTRDALANIALMKKVCKELKKSKLEIIDGGDHSFKVPKTDPNAVFENLASLVANWMK